MKRPIDLQRLGIYGMAVAHLLDAIVGSEPGSVEVIAKHISEMAHGQIHRHRIRKKMRKQK